MKTFSIEEEYIQLIQLLKASRLAQSGGEAQQLVVEGLVKVNGRIESRKRAKLRPGDVIEFNGQSIKIVSK
ncbi:RNA-binding S4 domain-containing protein [Perlabentimonas gracilis]|uniref:RNA-binding S4 domain-containing protein n=1 Tax=Perlabentimonas gracilis TaxID=2715279 RepID=UPI0014099E61|nr:RNA-binding S4 domain-containing protein [Perlabentimonas gracilis]NHB70095.1 RNA-binding S4 domain-containing protein [Perlabentimonas gracilis]